MAELPYRVIVWDNFHYMDDEEAYELGPFATYEEALTAAKRLVEEEIAHYEYDMGLYCGFGEDPVVLGPPGVPIERFSGREYARTLCETRAKEKEE